MSWFARPVTSPPSPYSTNHYPPRRTATQLPPLGLPKFYKAHEPAPYTGGLRTPPSDDAMSIASSNPFLSNAYDGHVALARQPQAAAQPHRSRQPFRDVSVAQATEQLPQLHIQPQPQQHQAPQPAQQQQQQQVQQLSARLSQQHTHPQCVAAPATAQATSSRHVTRPTTPSSIRSEGGTISKRESAMVTHSLKLPPCISTAGGSLDEFASLMTCFFWFESMDTLNAAERIHERNIGEPVPRLSKYTEPLSSYKKWVHSILSTTQVTQNVVLLALLFVHRLKQSNPKVNGNPGSEYRLLTVALMLGNKFLDDNTYTNKTWAEVSGISVQEIHVMEVEFLSNMRYGLLTSKDQWEEWLGKLACYHEYCARARMEEKRQQVPPVIFNGASPTHTRLASPLPSPTSILPSSMQSAPAPLTAYSPNAAANLSNQEWPAYHPTVSISPHGAKPSLGVSQKRCLEDFAAAEPPPKRFTQHPHPHAQMPVTFVPRQPHPDERVRLPIPQLTLDTAQPATYPTPSAPNYQAPPAMVSLPPLGAGPRSMSTVYPPSTTATWAPQGNMVASCGPQTPSYTGPPSNFSTPSKRMSPGTMYNSSPMAEPYGVHTPTTHSPTFYLQQRNSPYKPIRRVNTLLYPPPTLPLTEYHLGSTQMHYQPLGRRNEYRSGIVPEFVRSGILTPSHHPH